MMMNTPLVRTPAPHLPGSTSAHGQRLGGSNNVTSRLVAPSEGEAKNMEQEDQDDTQPFPDQQIVGASKEGKDKEVKEKEPEVQVEEESLVGTVGEASAAKKAKTSSEPTPPQPRAPIDVYRGPMRLIGPAVPAHRDPNVSADESSVDGFRPNAIRVGRMPDAEFSAFLAAGGLDDPMVYHARFPGRHRLFERALNENENGSGGVSASQPEAEPEVQDLTQDSQESGVQQ
jgi:hypothetical protein